MQYITFVELPHFTKYVYEYLTDEGYIGLQTFLMQYPDAGDVVPGSGGCRKLRWGQKDEASVVV